MTLSLLPQPSIPFSITKKNIRTRNKERMCMDVTRKNIITLITSKIAARVYFSVHRYIIFSTDKKKHLN